jgi:Domain of unknown function (DUF4381)
LNPTDFAQIPLRDIHLPGAVGWWPPAPGWWILVAIALGAAVTAVLLYRRRYRERAALRALRGVIERLQSGDEPVHCLQQISMILRRFAMSLAEHSAGVAGLTGARWLAYLDSHWERTAFSAGPGRLLAAEAYAPPGRVAAVDVENVGTVCREWINAQRRHRGG